MNTGPMTLRIERIFSRIVTVLVAAAIAAVPAGASRAETGPDFETAFDRALGKEPRGPRTFDTALEARIAAMAEASKGRIGVAALDLSSGTKLDVLGDQLFPMASTSKIAIAATYLEGVDEGKWSLSSEWPLMIAVRSAPHSSIRAPVRPGNYLPAIDLIELMITRSSNPATDALLAAVGGPAAVNRWVKKAGVKDFQITRDIATLVRDDGDVDPASVIDPRDSATPLAMIELLSGFYEGRWLSPASRNVLLGAMGRTVTGKHRIPALMPPDARVAHKTGSLFNTSSDIGIIHAPDGRAFAVAIYVTGQGSRPNRERRIAEIARAIYDGFVVPAPGYRLSASR